MTDYEGRQGEGDGRRDRDLRRVATAATACKTCSRLALALLLLLLLLVGLPGALRAQVPPDAEWKTLETEHFRITFPAGMEAVAREAADRAERARAGLAEALVEPRSGRVEILLTDFIDSSNGFARVAPRREVTLYARPPVDGFALSHFDDWLEVILIHELAHVVHLDVTGPLGGFLRRIFGRAPVPWPLFPHQASPRWAVEGLATWYESAMTGAGRVRGTHHEMVLRTAVLEERFESIDQASGESPVWPAGQRPYIYGSLFFDHLVERYGEEGMSRFVQALGDDLLPWRLNAAARDAFGVSFSEAWEAWREELEEETRAQVARRTERVPATVPEPVTEGARMALQPRLSPDGRVLVHARSDARDDPRLQRSGPGGQDPEGLTRTNGVATFDFLPDGRIVMAQLERADSYRMYSDLWLVEPGGDTHRLTRESRLEHPSATPDGREVVAIRNGGGTTALVTVALADGTIRQLVPPEPNVHWAYPAVSPDGSWIAAARWTDGAHFDVVILDRDGRLVAEVTRDRALDTAPAWSPDGRWLLWASDRSGIQDILAVAVDPATGQPGEALQVTNIITGAHFPSVSPDGRWIYLTVYHADGWEVERLPFEPERWFDPFPLAPRFLTGAASEAPDRRAGTPDPASDTPDPGADPRETTSGPSPSIEDYSPLSTLFPRYWQPIYRPPITAGGADVIGSSWGLVTRGQDLVGRHTLDLAAALSTSDARFSGSLGYTWAGLGNPLLSLRLGQSWDAFGPFALEEEDGGTRPVYLDEREQSVTALATFQRLRVRHALSLTLAGGLDREKRSVLEADGSPSTARLVDPDSRLTDLSATLSFATARGHAFSISPEEGVAASVRVRRRQELDLPDDRRDVAGSDRSVDETVGQIRLYQDLPGPGFADHVVALRASGGAATGPGADAFWFDVGGAAGGREPLSGMGLFGGRSWLFPARGWRNGERSGRYAWSASAEYRIPLALVNRGLGLLPIHLDRISGSLFADAANAWGPELGISGFDNPRQDPLASAGVEIAGDFLTFFGIPLTLRGGWAARLTEGGSALYLRLGRAF